MEHVEQLRRAVLQLEIATRPGAAAANVLDMLRHIEPFSDIGPICAQRIKERMVRLRVRGSLPVLRKGADEEALHLILCGRVCMVVGNGERRLILSNLGPGDVFGLYCVVPGSTTSADVVAAVQTELLRIPADALGFLAEEPHLSRLQRLQRAQLCELQGVAGDLGLCGVEQRLRRAVARIAQRQGRYDHDTGTWIVGSAPTQGELAEMVGSCRETVSRTLASMVRQGSLSIRGRRLVVAQAFIAEALS